MCSVTIHSLNTFEAKLKEDLQFPGLPYDTNMERQKLADAIARNFAADCNEQVSGCLCIQAWAAASLSLCLSMCTVSQPHALLEVK